MRTNKALEGQESGGILVLFCLLIAVVVGVMSLSFYIGSQIEQKISLQNTSDASSLAVTNHLTQGLNMISANNLTIGASMHVAASMPIIATYASLVYAFTTSMSDIVPEAASLALDTIQSAFPAGNSFRFISRYQKNIWNKIAIVTSTYIAIATGTTEFNKLLVSYWMIPAPLRSMEIARLNTPGSLAYSVQQSSFTQDGGTSPLLMSYAGLAQSTAEQAVCHTLKASRRIANKAASDNVISWALAPLMATPNQTLNEISGRFTRIFEKFNSIAPIHLTFTDCGWGSKGGLLSMLRGMGKALSKGQSLNPVLKGKAISALHSTYLSSTVAGTHSYRDKVVNEFPQCPGNDALYQSEVTLRTAASGFNPGQGGEDLIDRYSFYNTLANIKDDLKNYPEEPNHNSYRCVEFSDGSIHDGFGHSYQSKNACILSTENKYKADYADWEKKRSPYTCSIENETTKEFETKYDSLAFSNAEGAKICVNLRVVVPQCAFIEYLKEFADRGHGGCFGRIPKRISSFIKNTCQNISFNDGKSDTVDELVSYRKQIETYDGKSNSGFLSSGSSDTRLDQIGYVYIKDKDAFESSLKLLTVVSSPLRIAEEKEKEPCPSEYEYEVDGVIRCNMKYLVDFAGKVKAQGSGAGNPKFDKEANAVRSGVSQLVQNSSDDLFSTWSRTQWATTYMEAHKKTETDYRLQLFWPDWYPVIKPNNFEFVSEVLQHFLSGETKNEDAKMIAIMQ